MVDFLKILESLTIHDVAITSYRAITIFAVS